MAELAKQISDAENDVRKAKFLLDQVNASAKRSGQTTPAQAKAQAAYDKAAKRLKIIREQQASKKSGVGSVSIPGVGQDTKSAKGSGMPSSFMNPTSNNISVDAGTSKILQEFKNENPNAVLDMNFFSTGQGAGLLVYTGKATGKESSPTGGSYNKIVDGTRMVTNEINRFNADPKLKNRVLSLIRKYDPRADEIDAWNTWKQAVSDAAGLYAGGTGLKITPEDLLNRQLAKSKKDAPYTGPETTLARKVYDEATVKSWMEEGLLKYLEKPALEPGDMADLQASILAMTNKYNKTVVTDNRKGKRTVTETPAFSQAQIESTIKKFAQEKDPVAYERTKSMAFFDWAMGLGN